MFTVSEGGGYLASQRALSIYVAALKTGCSQIACRNTVRQQWGACLALASRHILRSNPCMRFVATIPGVCKSLHANCHQQCGYLFSQVQATLTERGYVWLRSRQSSGGELGGGSESVVHARVSQVVVEVLDGALACTANDPAQLIDRISSQPRQKATKQRDSFEQHHAMFASLLDCFINTFADQAHVPMRGAE